LPAKKTTWAWLTGTFLGIGMVGRGGGTLASVPVVLAWIFLEHLHPTTFGPYWTAFALLATVIGVPASTVVACESGLKDPSQVVIDEVSGQSIALLFAPVLNWKYALAGFILFRAFDILKPPPVRQLEMLPEGWGIMMDDVAAGVLALIVLQIATHFHLFG
jgi:phosphatidylglycerophosphatase A